MNVAALPKAGDEVSFGTGRRRYVIGVVYEEAKDGRPLLLLSVNEGMTPGVLTWFEVVGRCAVDAVSIVKRGAFARRVGFWRKRYPW